MQLKSIRIGTRGSHLALAQAGQIQSRLKRLFPKISFDLVVVKTMGDEFQGVELFKKNNVGVFTKTLEEKLLQKEIDVAIHSLKDLPTDLPKGLFLAAYPKREDARDVLISRNGYDLKKIPTGSRVGTTSLRRQRQIALLRPDLQIEDMRGNLDTRVAKVLKSKEFDAVVVARAGLRRLGIFLKQSQPISIREMLPAVGQAVLGVEVRRKDKALINCLRKINHQETEICAKAERIFLKTLQGGCRVPAGIHSKISKNKIYLKASIFSTREAASISSSISGAAQNYPKLAIKLARILLANGGKSFLREARANA